MKRSDLIKLKFIRNWNFPGRERLSHWLKPSKQLQNSLKDGIVLLNNEDIAIYSSADNYIEWTILNTGTYEEEIGRLIKISLNNGATALDIGANIGLNTLRMAQCCGTNGKVYAFEPLQHLQKKLKNNIDLNNTQNVVVFPFALADYNGEADFIVNTAEWNQGTFSLSNKGSGSSSQHVIIQKGDAVPEIINCVSIDLIKIDVEGFEYQVIKGLDNTLKKHKPRIIFEYDSAYWHTTQQQIAHCYSYLTALNYVVYQITPVGCELIKNAEDILSGNLFCISVTN